MSCSDPSNNEARSFFPSHTLLCWATCTANLDWFSLLTPPFITLAFILHPMVSAASVKTVAPVVQGMGGGKSTRFHGVTPLPDLNSNTQPDDSGENEDSPEGKPDPLFNEDGTWRGMGEKDPIVISNMTLAIVESGTPEAEVASNITAQSHRLEDIVNKVRDQHSLYCTRNVLGVTNECPRTPYRIYANASVLAATQTRWASSGKIWRSARPCAPNARGDMVGSLDTWHRDAPPIHAFTRSDEPLTLSNDSSVSIKPNYVTLRSAKAVGMVATPLDSTIMQSDTIYKGTTRSDVIDEAREDERGIEEMIEKKQEAIQNTTESMGFWPEADPDGPVDITDRTLAIVGADTAPWMVDAHVKAQAVRLNGIIAAISANHSMYCDIAAMGMRQSCPSSQYHIYANASVIESVAPYWISWKSWWRKLIPCNGTSSDGSPSMAVFHSPHRNISVVCV
ncbi:hypothetical protein BJ684DRAFT_17003 [Piptocephalis cylindrospora]|uniref:Uncharacterized protein n=1 Tax=Piptocephalis cylindrospora TaxID=1907219 RepID=A0A4P9Y1H1_9FUNG|nr:hypothetical protein BJ684DRAFT_17003 [Piptocephalis cylindrospora]|eukprot:RKP12514.1 hypothetical protein BJ684DRAFT_17003 [Piptocephalis cylindrospora]